MDLLARTHARTHTHTYGEQQQPCMGTPLQGRTATSLFAVVVGMQGW